MHRRCFFHVFLLSFIFLVARVSCHAHIHCHEEESCSNKRLFWTDASDEHVGIHCHGFASCYNSSIESDLGIWTPNCDAAASCIKMTQDEDEIMTSFTCGGFYSCHQSFSLSISVNTISCGAEKSCFGSQTQLNSNYIQCNGFKSCQGATIVPGSVSDTTSATLLAYGVKSLENAKIKTFGAGKSVTFRLYGTLATTGALIECRGNDSCQLHCYTPSSCANVTLKCAENATCSAYFYDFAAEAVVQEDSWQLDQLDQLDAFESEQVSHIFEEMEVYVEGIGSEGFEYYYDEMCGEFNLCADKYACENESVNLGITNTGQLEEKKYWCVTGYAAANDVRVVTQEQIDVIVDGANSLTSGSVSAGNIHCRGEDSCKGRLSTVSGDGSIICTGADSCQRSEATWSGIGSLYCYGRNSCTDLTGLVGINNIYALAHSALEDSVINSKGDMSRPQVMKIYLGGYAAGTRMKVNCLASDKCLIVCVGSSLECVEHIEFDFVCDDTATCAIVTLEQALAMPATTGVVTVEGAGADGTECEQETGLLLWAAIVLLVVALVQCVLLMACMRADRKRKDVSHGQETKTKHPVSSGMNAINMGPTQTQAVTQMAEDEEEESPQSGYNPSYAVSTDVTGENGHGPLTRMAPPARAHRVPPAPPAAKRY